MLGGRIRRRAHRRFSLSPSTELGNSRLRGLACDDGGAHFANATGGAKEFYKRITKGDSTDAKQARSCIAAICDSFSANHWQSLYPRVEKSHARIAEAVTASGKKRKAGSA